MASMEEDDMSRSLHLQFHPVEENGEIATFKLEDSLEQTEKDISRFLHDETDGGPFADKHIVHQASRPNFEFLAGRSRSTLIYRRIHRPSALDKKRKGMGWREKLSTMGWAFLSLALLQSECYSCLLAL